LQKRIPIGNHVGPKRYMDDPARSIKNMNGENHTPTMKNSSVGKTSSYKKP